MKKRIRLSLCCLSLMSLNLNAQGVSLGGSINRSQNFNYGAIMQSVQHSTNTNSGGGLLNSLFDDDSQKDDESSSKTDSVKEDDVQFVLELGAKTDFWEPGLSKKDGQDLLKYDAEGLYLGYATFKTKIKDTDVFTFEKFGTLTSSSNQKVLLEEYKSDKKKESSIDGYKMSIHLMKILNYWFDSNFLNGLEYRYKTRNFIGEAKLQHDALYWFGKSSGLPNIDFFSYKKDSTLSFKTKFTDHRLVYTSKKRANQYNMDIDVTFGAFDSKWSKPTYIGVDTKNGDPVIFPANYRTRGLTLGLDMTFDNLGFDVYLDYGIDNKFDLADGVDAEQFIKDDDMDLTMYTAGAKIKYVIPNIYSNSYLNLNFILSGDVYRTYIDATNGAYTMKLDEETLYSVQTALEFTF